MKIVTPWIFIIVLLISHEVSGQTTTAEGTYPFGKGRFITGINGSIRSGQKSRTSASSAQEAKTFDFTLGTQSGIFIRDRLLFGGSLQVSKSKSETDVVELNEEVFTIGPWSRYYLGKDHKGSIFLEMNVYFARENIDTRAGASLNQQLTGNGIGASLGAGFTYVVNPNIGFDLTLGYNVIQFYAKDKDLITDTSSRVNFGENFLTVTFGFRIMLNEFFF